MGLPVLAFEAEGVRELVHEGVNGHIYPHGDVQALTLGLETLLQRPEIAHAMGAHAPTLVDDRWQITTMQAKTQSLYQELLAAKGLL